MSEKLTRYQQSPENIAKLNATKLRQGFLKTHGDRDAVVFEGDQLFLGLDISSWRWRECRTCGRVFARRDKRGDYCSYACAKHPGHTHETRNGSAEYACEECGTLVRRYNSDIAKSLRRGATHIYCGRKCAAMHSRPPNNTLIHKPDLAHPVRSLWEANVARWLLWLGLPYEYEPERIRMADTVYIPDFRVASAFWIEVKGWWRPGAREKVGEFAAQTGLPLVVIDVSGYRDLEHRCLGIVPGWELAHW